MQSFCRTIRVIESHVSSSKIVRFKSCKTSMISADPGLIVFEPNVSIAGGGAVADFFQPSTDYSKRCLFPLPLKFITQSPVTSQTKFGFQTGLLASSRNNGLPSVSLLYRSPGPGLFQCGMVGPTFPNRRITTMGNHEESISQDGSASIPDLSPRIKFKRLNKTAHHIMQILDKEAVEEVRIRREIPDIKPGYIVQLKVEVPENKRRVSIVKGIVIARRNAGLNTTFRLRRLVAGVGVESVFPLYSPNIKEMKVLDKKKVRRAKLYYLRDKMNALKKH